MKATWNRRDFFKVAGALAGTQVHIGTAKADEESQNRARYVKNRWPLVQTPFIPLPLGSVQADGWLLRQLELQSGGATGNSEAIYQELAYNSAWLGASQGNMSEGSDWERPPYYVKGLVALAYTLKNNYLIEKARKWIDWSINSQQREGPYAGAFGPSWNYYDWWPRMPMLYAMKDFYEATEDARVLPFLSRYFQFQAYNLDAQPMTSWAKARLGDNVDVILWLYNRTGEEFLLNLADKIRGQGFDFTDMLSNNHFDWEGHAVNVAQYMKAPAIFYQRSNNGYDREAYLRGHENLMRDHGQVTGMPSGTEWLADRSSTQGVELCSIVERMQSAEEALMIVGDPAIGDQLEKIAYNSLPGAMDKTGSLHQYYSLPNQYQSVHGNTGFGQDHNNDLCLSPNSGYPCCRFNLHMGWPYFVKNMWAATDDGGAAVMAYGPSRVTLPVGSEGILATIRETTDYPFNDKITLTMNLPQSVAFPLKLRIPAWAAGATVQLNGSNLNGVSPGSFFTIQRTWNHGDRVELIFPMTLATSTQINNSVAIERGPVIYSLDLAEKWYKTADGPLGFNEYELRPSKPWNYGLLVDRQNPGASITLQKAPMNAYPFSPLTTPVKLIVLAKKLPWGTIYDGMRAEEVRPSPYVSREQTEQVTLVPYGSQNIRMTYFPQLIEGDSAVVFYTDAYFQGLSAAFGPGEYTYDQLLSAGFFNDAMSSLNVPAGWVVEVYQDDYFSGAKWTFYVDTPMIPADANDQMSSMKIYRS